MTRSTTSPEKKPILHLVIPPVFWLGVWQLAAFLVDRSLGGRGNEVLLPYPLTVLNTLLALLPTADFWQTVGLSLLRILAGLLIGTLLGSLLALLTSAFRWADLLLSPAIRVIRATPVASFIVLVILWVYTDRVPVVISALMVLPVMWANVSQGVRETDPKLLELARAYGFSPLKTLRLIRLPSLLPYFTAGLATCVGLAWKSGVAAEVLCQPLRAIGSRIFRSRITLEIPTLFAWTVVVVVLSLILERILTRLISRLGRRDAP